MDNRVLYFSWHTGLYEMLLQRDMSVSVSSVDLYGTRPTDHDGLTDSARRWWTWLTDWLADRLTEWLLDWLILPGGGGSPGKPLTANTGLNADLHGMDGVVVNQSLLELAAAGQYIKSPLLEFYLRSYCWFWQSYRQKVGFSLWTTVCIAENFYTLCPKKVSPLNILQQPPQTCTDLNEILHTQDNIYFCHRRQIS